MYFDARINSRTHFSVSCQTIKKKTNLEVSMHNSHVMEIFDSIQNLLNEFTGIFFCVEALLYDAVKQLPTRHPEWTKETTPIFGCHNDVVTSL